MSRWPMVPLGEVLIRRKEEIDVQEHGEYVRLTIRLNGRGIDIRDRVPGSMIGTKRQFVARHGQLVLSKIDARNGAFGVLPRQCHEAIITGNFWAFDIDDVRLEPRYFEYFSKTPAFLDFCIHASEGTTNRRYLQESKFLEFAIPLPPLEEQRRIVARIERLSSSVGLAHSLQRHVMEESQTLLNAARQIAFAYSSAVMRLGEVCTVIDPNPSHRYPAYAHHGVPIVSSSEFVGEHGLDWSLAKHVPEAFYEATLGRFGVGEGDVLFSRKGKLGYARLHPPGVKLALTHTLCVLQPDKSIVHPRYLLHFARSPMFLDGLNSQMNPNVGVPTLGLKVIRDATIPVPPIDDQGRIAATLDQLESRVGSLICLQSAVAAELSLLASAVLSRAFSGPILASAGGEAALSATSQASE